MASACVLALAGVELAAYAQDNIEPVPQGSCLSPFAVTSAYVDPGMPQWLVGAGLSSGLVIRGHVPSGAIGVEAGFKAPDAPDYAWQTSQLVPADSHGNFVYKVGIGEGWVVFGTRSVGPPAQSPGSEVCNQPPAVQVQHYDQNTYFRAPGQNPWDNLVNTAVNIVP